VTDPFELEDVWINAFAAFPDVEPLVRLLREGNTPMTPCAQGLLANLLSPHDPPSDGFVLKVERKPKWDRMLGKGADPDDGDSQKWDDGGLGAIALYVAMVNAKVPSKEAAEEAGRTMNVTARQFYRYLTRWRALVRYLRGQ
jgi:hypothetical protein